MAHLARLQLWKVRRPTLLGVRVLALDAQGRVLLVRHSYGSGNWMPPSGGLRPGESPLDTAVRELAEETGCVLADPLVALEIEERLHGARNRVHVVTGTTAGTPRADGREIVEAAFFALDALPWPRASDKLRPLRDD